ncbi:hypothetical protein SUGI_1206520 [Cryptomeria japonica]|uniref:RING-H2 finger protein ATL79-like n=1 Tax=Cryptomeria japonica TaxID=3369 RepID=UPI0024147027|nr:RING-H2 finger protein ATL79-like [Cryptomeria japonica]GLJ56191.1 hypothetical protein SUGI_1206520 [Cryptomeria japonica]
MPLIARRRCCASSPLMLWLITLWMLFIFAFPLFLFRYVFNFRSPYFYVAYASVLLIVTYVAFSEKVEDEPPPPPSAARQMVDVDMPLFNYKAEVEDGRAEQCCVICLSNYDEAQRPALSLPTCRHNFHVECVGKWLRIHGRCPICSASPFPTHDAQFPPPDVVRVSVAMEAPNTREYGNLTP